MTDWFIKQDEDTQDLGPLRPPDLLRMVRQGSVTRQTLIRKNDSAYFQAGQVGGLFEAAMRPTIEHFCPSCKHSVSEPPTNCSYCGRDIERAITKITENTIQVPSQTVKSQAGLSVRNWLKKKKIVKDPSDD